MISIILPILNPNQYYFESAISSILNQTLQDFEIIIIEDPGQTSSEDSIKKFDCNKIKYIKNRKRMGFANQLNYGIKVSQGEYIARFDGDDVAAPNRLECQYTVLKKNSQIDIIGSNIKLIDHNDTLLGFRKYPEIHSEISKKMSTYCAVAHPSVMGKRSVFIDSGGYNKNFGITADYDLWARCIKKQIIFHNIQKELLAYRIHSSASKHKSLKQTLLNTIKIKEKHFKNSPLYWGPEQRGRLICEKLLLTIPSNIVYKLFMCYIKKYNE